MDGEASSGAQNLKIGSNLLNLHKFRFFIHFISKISYQFAAQILPDKIDTQTVQKILGQDHYRS